MIGVFDSGLGGLTVFRALVQRFPNVVFVYLGDHANVPYGDRASDDIVALTRRGVDTLFRQGCRLVLLGCNTATCIAARTLQQGWLPVSGWPGRNVLGIVAPTVEAATQTPWAVTTPQYPQALGYARNAHAAGCMTLIGGTHVTFTTQTTLRLPYVDFVIRGEGEQAASILAKEIATHGRRFERKHVPSLSWYDALSDRVIDNPQIPDVRTVDDLPRPGRHLLNMEPYKATRLRGRPVTTV